MRVEGKVIPGYGVASSQGKDARYPLGTIREQVKHFQQRGLDLSPFFMGTINVDIAPHSFSLGKPKHFFDGVNWSSHIPPENFYFFDVKLHYRNTSYEGFVYMPDPATKPEHMQKETVLELILPKIEDLAYDQLVELEVDRSQLLID